MRPANFLAKNFASVLPIPFFLLTIVDEGTLVAVLATDALDGLLGFRVDEALAITNLVVILAVEELDKLGADGVLLPASHLVVEVEHAALAQDTDGRTVERALAALHQFVSRIDSLTADQATVDILPSKPAQAVFTMCTMVDETH